MSAAESVKVVLLGESGVGKTSIISQFTTGSFDPEVVTSISAQYVSKTVEYDNYQKAIKFDIWDTAGQEKYRALAKIFYKEAKVVLLVYDISDRKSFEELKGYWYNAIKENVDTDAIIAIVANKSDLYNSSQVDENEAKEYAKSINALYQLTSAKSNVGINSLFDNIGQKYFDPNYDFNAVDNKEKEEYQKKKEETKQKKKEPKGMKITNETAGQKEKKKKGFC